MTTHCARRMSEPWSRALTFTPPSKHSSLNLHVPAPHTSPSCILKLNYSHRIPLHLHLSLSPLTYSTKTLLPFVSASDGDQKARLCRRFDAKRGARALLPVCLYINPTSPLLSASLSSFFPPCWRTVSQLESATDQVSGNRGPGPATSVLHALVGR